MATAAKKTATTKSTQDYTAHHLQVLEGLEAVRKRPGMYIGSTDSRGLMHCLWEIIDNSVDEALGGHCDRIEVVLFEDGSVEVRDNGRGVPVDIEPKTGLTGVELVYTRLHAGGKFGGGSYTASGGLHGVGASVVNALSSRLDVQVDRGGKTYAMSFRRGEPGVFSDVAGAQGRKDPEHAFTPYVAGSQLDIVGNVRRGITGTRVRYWADHQIFLKDAEFDLGAGSFTKVVLIVDLDSELPLAFNPAATRLLGHDGDEVQPFVRIELLVDCLQMGVQFLGERLARGRFLQGVPGAQRQQDGKRNDPAHEVQREGRNVVAHQTPHDRVAGPQQRGDGQQERRAGAEFVGHARHCSGSPCSSCRQGRAKHGRMRDRLFQPNQETLHDPCRPDRPARWPGADETGRRDRGRARPR